MIRFQKRNFDIFATIQDYFEYLNNLLWFAFKKGTLIYLQQLNVSMKNKTPCCDSLSKKELWYICNNKITWNRAKTLVVIRFQKRNFDIFATINRISFWIIRQLWFAFKKGTLIYLQQSNINLSGAKTSCDSLSKKELWYICNNAIIA